MSPDYYSAFVDEMIKISAPRWIKLIRQIDKDGGPIPEWAGKLVAAGRRGQGPPQMHRRTFGYLGSGEEAVTRKSLFGTPTDPISASKVYRPHKVKYRKGPQAEANNTRLAKELLHETPSSVPKVFKLDESKGPAIMNMSLMKGRKIKSFSDLSQKERNQLDMTVKTLYRKGWSHGDLNPNNVLIGKDGPQIIDWSSLKPTNKPDRAFGEVVQRSPFNDKRAKLFFRKMREGRRPRKD